MSFKTKVVHFAVRQALLVKKESPTILFVVGVASVGTSTVLACRATLKTLDILDEAEKTKVTIYDSVGKPVKGGGVYSPADEIRDAKVLKIQTAVKLGKLYAPAAVLMIVGVASLSGSHYLLNKRNAALGAALAGLEQTHREYRRRVAQELGTEKEKQLHHEAQYAAMHERNKDGTPSKTRRKGPHESSIYARFFDQLNPNWDKTPEYNKMFLHSHQQYFTNRLNARGYLFLNEVYRDLGIPESKAGNVVGWMITDDESTDNFVDFGIFDGNSRELRAFVNGEENSILLDFNVAGNILDRVKFKNE